MPDVEERRRPRREGVMLRLMLLLAGLLRGPAWLLGAEPAPFAAILAVKLRLDTRRSPWNAAGESRFGGLPMTCAMNALFGGLFGLMAFASPDPVLYLHLAMAVSFVFVVLGLLGDFTHVLFDTSDHAVLGHRPVRERTVFIARLCHVLIYLGLITGAMALGPVLIGSLRYGAWPFLPVAVLGYVSVGLVAAFGAVLLFVLAMRVMPGDRFKDFVVWLQVGVSVLVFGGFQLAGQLLQDVDVPALLARHGWLRIAVPMTWPGSLLELLLGRDDGDVRLAAALCLVVPVGLAVLVVGVARTGFLSRLGEMAVADAGGEAGRADRPSRLARTWTRAGVERAGWDFFRRLSRRERPFKMRVYSMLAMALVMGGVFTWRFADGSPEMMVSALYLTGFYAPAILVHSRYTESYRANWLFDALPFAEPELFVIGAMKCFLAAFVLPTLALFAAILLAIGGLDVLPDVLLAAGVALAAALAAVAMVGARVPFSEQFVQARVASATSVVWAMLVPLVAAITAHVLLRPHPVAMWAVVVAVLLADLIAMLRLAPLLRSRVRARRQSGYDFSRGRSRRAAPAPGPARRGSPGRRSS